MGSFDSVRLMPHSAHDDSAFFDRPNSTSRSIAAKHWGRVVENFFRPSESVTDVGSFDSVRLMPHSAHDDSAFFDRRNSTSRSIAAKHGAPWWKISSGHRSPRKTWDRSTPFG